MDETQAGTAPQSDRPMSGAPSSGSSRASVPSSRPVRERYWSVRRIAGVLLAAAIVAALWLGPDLWKSAFHHLAVRALQQHDTTEAFRLLDRADAWGTPSATTALLQARAARRAGQVNEFHRYLKLAEARGAKPLSLQRETLLMAAQSGQLQRAAPHLSALLTDTSGDNKDVCLAYVTGYLRTQRIDDALVLLDAWMKDAPQDPLPWLIRGRIKRYRQNYADAESDLRHSLQLQPHQPEVLVELAELLSEGNRIPEARSLFEQVLQQDQFRARAATGLARCLKSLGEFDSALRLLAQETTRAPDDAALWLEFGRLQFENAEFAAAAQSLQRTLDLQPWNDEAMYILAQCLNQLDQPDQARELMSMVDGHREALAELETLKDGLRKNPSQVELLVRAGELLLKYSDPDEAAITLQSALDIAPDHVRAHELLAEYYLRQPDRTSYQESMLQWHRQQAGAGASDEAAPTDR